MFNFFDIQFYLLAEWLVPIRLRTAVLMAFVKACFEPVIMLHNDFMAYRLAKKYEIKMNWQTCYVEAFLNDRFDKTARRIYIDDAPAGEQPIYLYQDEELQPLYLSQDSENEPVYTFTEGETIGSLLYDFIVYVPVGVAFNENEMRAMLSTKICGKRYKIEIF